ncbi:MAG: VWA domain-containing protein [Cyclobacteriaceae bacterium]
MDNSWYSVEVSPWWVVLAMILAAGFAVLLYSKSEVPWSKSMNILMGFLRWSAVFLIILLLINPKLKMSTNESEKPLIVIALDNSESITLRTSGPQGNAVKNWVDALTNELQQDYQVELQLLNESKSDSVQFDFPQTDLGGLLKTVKNIYADKNLAGVVLASDGIINAGHSPGNSTYPVPVFSVGLGDTISPKDLSIQSVRHNKVAYQGNKFPLSIKVYQKGYNNKEVQIQVKNGSKLIERRTVTLAKTINEINFILPADKPGANRLSISIDELAEESTLVNNVKDVFIDVIDGKDEILILAPAPHPDINAIREVLSSNENLSITVYIPGIHPRPSRSQFDAIIEHQAFDNTNYGDFEAGGRWYILGNRTRLPQVAAKLNYLSIVKKGNGRAIDMVRGYLNNSFSKFKLNQELLDRLEQYPPVGVPFGDYQVSGPTENLLLQQVGSLETDRPLLTFYDNGSSKSAVLVGSGIWQWKLQEYASEENYDFFKSLVLKTVQYLSIKTNKERLIASPRKSTFRESERVYIDTEVYSDIFERTYGNTISLSITDEAGQVDNYELVDNPASNSFSLGRLKSGVYQFKTSVELGGKSYAKSGSFSVENIQIEALNLTADHNLLRSISKNSGGQFFPFSDVNWIPAVIAKEDFPNVIHTWEEKYPLIETVWIMLLIAVLLFSEWFLRKYLGAY